MGNSPNIFTRAWNSRPVTTLRTLFEIYGIIQTLVVLGGSMAVPAAVAAGVALLADASWPLVVLIGAGGYVLAFVGILYLLPWTTPVGERIKDKEIKRDCCELSEKLFAFLEERAPDHPQKRLEAAMTDPSEGDTNELLQEATRYNQETETQYQERFGREVGYLLDASERRGWSTAEERKKLESGRWWGLELPDDRIRRTAQHLENVCRNA